MTRSMVKYQFIADEKARNATLKKRKPSLIKKMEELKSLCDVDACLVMYDGEGGPPEVWPSPSEAQRVIQRFQDATAVAPARGTLDHVAYLEKSIAKVKKHLEKETEKNDKKVMKMLVERYGDVKKMSLEELNLMNASIDSEIERIDRVIEEKKKKGKEICLDLSL